MMFREEDRAHGSPTVSLSIIVALFMLASAMLLNNGRPQRVSAQTIPSRTPTPAGGGATATPDGDGGPGPQPTALPTSTGSGPQATATPIVNPPTPSGGFLPTAQPCDLEPTIISLANGINVRFGPGTNYESVGQLKFKEVRPIIGRAADTSWWQIILVDGTVGWVADSVVETNGYIGLVAVVDPPELEDGNTPTPGTPWSPTPFPGCTAPPTPSPAATAAPSETPGSTSTTTRLPEGDEEGVSPGLSETTSATALPSATAMLASGSRVTPESIAGPTAEPLPGEDEIPGGTPWIPIAGIGLILAAAGLFVVQRLRG